MPGQTLSAGDRCRRPCARTRGPSVDPSWRPPPTRDRQDSSSAREARPLDPTPFLAARATREILPRQVEERLLPRLSLVACAFLFRGLLTHTQESPAPNDLAPLCAVGQETIVPNPGFIRLKRPRLRQGAPSGQRRKAGPLGKSRAPLRERQSRCAQVLRQALRPRGLSPWRGPCRPGPDTSAG